MNGFACQYDKRSSDYSVCYQVVLSILSSHGYSETRDVTDANLVLLNTCAIRDKPERKIWSRMTDFRKLKDRALLDKRLVTHCFGVVEFHEVAFSHRDVSGTSTKGYALFVSASPNAP